MYSLPPDLLTRTVRSYQDRNLLIVATGGNDRGAYWCIPAVLSDVLMVGAMRETTNPCSAVTGADHIKRRKAWRRGKRSQGDVAPTGLGGTRHRVVSRAPGSHFRIKGSAIIVPLHRCDFMAEIGQDGKEQIFPWAAQGVLSGGSLPTCSVQPSILA